MSWGNDVPIVGSNPTALTNLYKRIAMRIHILYDTKEERDAISEHLYSRNLKHWHDNKSLNGYISVMHNDSVTLDMEGVRDIIPIKDHGLKDRDIAGLATTLRKRLMKSVSHNVLRVIISECIVTFLKTKKLRLDHIDK